jgi:muramoyltetrapeptide carboxypeptidase
MGVAELRGLGFEPVFDDSVFDRRGYVAGEAANRAEAIRRAWSDRSIAALIGARGGYGSVQVLPWLTEHAAREGRKAFIGYSDLTSVLSFLSTACEMICFHGPTVVGKLEKGLDGYDRATFLAALTTAEPMGELSPPGLRALVNGEATGTLFGGTLSQLVASLGTPYAFNPPAGCILFLEDVGERPYRIDRMLTQLRLSGVIERAKGLVFGELPGCREADGRPAVESVIADVLHGFKGPILFGFPSGHTTGPSFTLPFGVAARVIGGSTPRLIVEEAAVE